MHSSPFNVPMKSPGVKLCLHRSGAVVSEKHFEVSVNVQIPFSLLSQTVGSYIWLLKPCTCDLSRQLTIMLILTDQLGLIIKSLHSHGPMRCPMIACFICNSPNPPMKSIYKDMQKNERSKSSHLRNWNMGLLNNWIDHQPCQFFFFFFLMID